MGDAGFPVRRVGDGKVDHACFGMLVSAAARLLKRCRGADAEVGKRRSRSPVAIWLEELGRAHAAARLYDDLRAGHRTSSPPHGRGRPGSARQVFSALYGRSSQETITRCGRLTRAKCDQDHTAPTTTANFMVAP